MILPWELQPGRKEGFRDLPEQSITSLSSIYHMEQAKQPITVDDLKKVIALSDLPDEHLQWILDHTEYRAYADGELIAKYGDPAEVMWIMLSGKVVFYLYVKGRQVYYFTFENNEATGGIGGIIALFQDEDPSRILLCPG